MLSARPGTESAGLAPTAGIDPRGKRLQPGEPCPAQARGARGGFGDAVEMPGGDLGSRTLPGHPSVLFGITPWKIAIQKSLGCVPTWDLGRNFGLSCFGSW